MKRAALALAIILVVAVAACDGENLPTTTGGSDTTAAPTTEAPGTSEAPTTEAPDTTAAPTTEAPGTPGDTADGDDADTSTDTPWGLLIVVGLALVILIVAFTRRGSKSATAIAPPVTWKTHAQRGYAEARWLYDALGEDIAVWRGNATFDGTADVGSTAATGKAETWAELQRRQGAALDSLYALEASPPDNRTAATARATITTLRATRDAVDARAEARFAYRTAEKEQVAPDQLIEARDREVRASRNLAEARNAYAQALTDLSTLV